MVVYAVQRVSDGAFLTKRTKANSDLGESGWNTRTWSASSPDLWNRAESAKRAANNVRETTKVVSFRLTAEVSE